MPQPKHLTALSVRPRSRKRLPADLARYFEVCEEKLGFVPNVLSALSANETKLRTFMGMYNELMLADSGLTKLEREMIAVVVSSANRCYYCLTAHGAAVRQLAKDPQLGEMLVMNWRTARLPRRQKALLAFAHKLTVTPAEVGEEDRARLRRVGLSDQDIWDAASVTGFFNYTNRFATATDLMPNPEYHSQAR